MTDGSDDLAFWDQRRGHIYSRKGGWTIGAGITNQGYSMLEDLVGKASYFQVLVLNVTGRLPEKRLAQWLENTFICMSWPDPRIWCNQIGALGGDTRVSPVAAVCAGSLASDSRLYGPGTVIDGVRFIRSAHKAIMAGSSIADFIEKNATVKGRLIAPGFARPIATGDERVVAMQALADRLDFEVGSHLELAYDIQAYLQQHYAESLNLAGYMCAFLIDLGFTDLEGYRIYSLCVNSGVQACYSEYCDRSSGEFLPLRCEDIDYTGARERPVPST